MTKILKKQTLKSKYIATYPCTKFQLIWGTSDLGTKFVQKSRTDKNFEKYTLKL